MKQNHYTPTNKRWTKVNKLPTTTTTTKTYPTNMKELKYNLNGCLEFCQGEKATTTKTAKITHLKAANETMLHRASDQPTFKPTNV